MTNCQRWMLELERPVEGAAEAAAEGVEEEEEAVEAVEARRPECA